MKNAGYKATLNKINSFGLPQFHTQGVGNSVPDIFFWDPNFENEIFSKEFIPYNTSQIKAGFIETKSGEHLGELIDAVMQNARYYGYFVSDKAKVFVEGNQIFNINCFLVGTKLSRNGMLYKGDEYLPPQPIPFISEAYNIVIPPYSIMLHSLVRKFQKIERNRLRSMKIVLNPIKSDVQTGIMVCKTPYDDNMDNEISYEYYSWLGKTMKVLSTRQNDGKEFIATNILIKKISKDAILIETKINEELWIPKSQIYDISGLTEKETYQIKISRLFYKRKEKQFGVI